ncbi:ribosomal-protein-alanine N-acetyltransferase [Pseudoflavonifractor sp. 524-17]|uniref:ribosomal protein S18-alanine N-acetyltransferase n=1 Tax=Pseudoflavonifractor sp. 524-17 TaxID=2304577 RepID=UPI00137A9FCC|nr:ribosomal protein S18-alanine N-acetyltransferase [Pseudoflavonifractor sp. 524-17]NCE65800.1 ribosomal-protein-alanine N-acetyltransferase [Pseudoflavonifractor sp. 524-17]
MNYQLVPMDRSHLPEVAELERTCFQHGWSEAMLAEELYNECVSCIVAQGADGAVLGYGMIRVVLDEGCLDKIAVDPACRRQGVAQGILEAFLRFGEAHLATLTLEVRAGNQAAIGLYRKLGFEEAGRRKNYYTGPGEDALLMTKEWPR